jgi:hypothetical protein
VLDARVLVTIFTVCKPDLKTKTKTGVTSRQGMCKTNTLPILMHQMHISTTEVQVGKVGEMFNTIVT